MPTRRLSVLSACSARLFATVALASAMLLPSSASAQKPAKKDSTAEPAHAKDEKGATSAGQTGQAGEQESDGAGAAAPTTPPPPADTWDITDVEEKSGRTYMFVGASYRGNIIPAFMLNLFVEQGKTIYTNVVGVEFDLRRDGFSIIPGLSFHEFGTDDILFKQKSTPDISGNYSVVNSDLKILYAKVDLLWSTKISKNVEFEYGAGFGLGAVFGNLNNNWVYENAGGPFVAENGKHYAECNTTSDGGDATNGPCTAAQHQGSDVNKVGGYTEKSWFNGGSKPSFYPWLSIPQIGLRIKPIKQFVGRIGLGVSLTTGFWFGFTGQYGLEQKPKD